MMYKNMKKRQSIIYKMKFWFYRLTFRDVNIGVKMILNYVIEFVMCALIFGLIFLVPAFFY